MTQPRQLPHDESLRKFACSRDNSRVIHYHVSIITPMMGGGVEAGEPDESMPYRAKSIRGHLRWWWRLLAHSGDLDPSGYTRFGKKPSEWSAIELQSCEAELFGSAVDGNPKKSKVCVEVINATAAKKLKYETKNRDMKWRPAVDFDELGYAMFPAQHQSPRPGRPARDALDIRPAGGTFELRVSSSAELVPTIANVVEHWATFGGIGARTRRGLGAVAVRRDGQLLCVLPPASAPSPCALWWSCRSLHADARDAHIEAIRSLHRFRQGEGWGRTRPRGRSLWPEGDTVRDETRSRYVDPTNRAHHHSPSVTTLGCFPRSAFGLPIGLRFHRDHAPTGGNDEPDRDPIAREIRPCKITNGAVSKTYNRMASPLILRPIAVMDHGQLRYRSAAAMIVGADSGDAVVLDPPAGAQGAAWQIWDAALTDPKTGVAALNRPVTAKAMFRAPSSAVEAFLNFFHNGG